MEHRETAFLCDEAMWARGHGESHPLRPERLRRTYELLAAYGAFDLPGSRLVRPPPARREELLLFHEEAYVDAVLRLGRGDSAVDPRPFNLGDTVNPVFDGMYETEALKTGGALAAARLVAEGEAAVAFSFAGGFHHAGPAQASGFCVFNDAAIAIQWLLGRGLRVAYVDIDVHHGDGVQDAFYDTDRVLTISLHQWGGTLFPGTGEALEVGTGVGLGYSLNVPLWPFTGDETYLWAFEQVVPHAVRAFAPDVLVTQLGADTHYLDPLAALTLTTHGYCRLLETLGALAAGTRGWVALGGGGYSLEVVPRAWTLAYGIMSGQAFPDECPTVYRERYGLDRLHDAWCPTPPAKLRDQVRTFARASVSTLRQKTGDLWPFPRFR